MRSQQRQEAERVFGKAYELFTRSRDLRVALELFHRAAELYGVAGNNEGLVRALKYMGDIHHDLGDKNAALSCYRKVIELDHLCDPKLVELIHARNLVAVDHFRRREYSQATVHLQRVLALQRLRDPAGRDPETGYAFGELGIAAAHVGEFSQAVDYLLCGLSVLSRSGDPNSMRGILIEMLENLSQQVGDRCEVLRLHNLLREAAHGKT